MFVAVVGLGVAEAASSRTWLAECRDGRAELVASVGDGGIDPHLGLPWTDGPDPVLVTLGAALSATRWYGVDGEVPGTPFPHPFVRNHWNDEGTTAFVAAPCEGDLCGSQRLVLGPCVGDGTIWATARFTVAADRVLKLAGGETIALVPSDAVPNVVVEQVVVTRPDGRVESADVEIEGGGC